MTDNDGVGAGEGRIAYPLGVAGIPSIAVEAIETLAEARGDGPGPSIDTGTEDAELDAEREIGAADTENVPEVGAAACFAPLPLLLLADSGSGVEGVVAAAASAASCACAAACACNLALLGSG